MLEVLGKAARAKKSFSADDVLTFFTVADGIVLLLVEKEFDSEIDQGNTGGNGLVVLGIIGRFLVDGKDACNDFWEQASGED